MTNSLFSPITFGNLEIRNRIGVSPMCQYSSVDGFASDWHVVHLGSRAVGGAGLVMMEATAVTPEGRITPACNGIWDDAHVEPLKRVTGFIREHGAAAAIQIAHAGRKASTAVPWLGRSTLTEKDGGWKPVAPSAVPFKDDDEAPHEMTPDDIKRTQDAFVAAARRAVAAGFQIVELHGAHGYLMHEFLSPLSNKREDDYGGPEENRFRFMLEIAKRVRDELPKDIVVGARLSCIDWAEGGLEIGDTVRLSAALKELGIAFIDCSSGALVANAQMTVKPGYQVPFAKEIRAKAGIPTCAVGLITEPRHANDIISAGAADMVFLARAMLRNPYWPVHAALELGAVPPVPSQYLRGYEPAALGGAGQRKAS